MKLDIQSNHISNLEQRLSVFILQKEILVKTKVINMGKTLFIVLRDLQQMH